MVFGVAPTQIFPDIKIAGAPEAAQVLSYLYRARSRGEQVKKQWYLSSPYPGCVEHTEYFLQPYSQHRRSGVSIIKRDPGAAGHFQVGRGQPVHFLPLLPC